MSALSRRLLPTLALTAITLLNPTPARADGALTGLGSDIAARLFVGSLPLLLPDLHFEWTDGSDSQAVYAWALPVSWVDINLGSKVLLTLDTRLELQYRADEGTRWLAAGRVPIYPGADPRYDMWWKNDPRWENLRPGIYGEAGYLFGSEDDGMMFGGGVIFGHPMINVTAGYRDLPGARRSVGMELNLALPVYWML